jgi:predicted Rossmann-fold nucleotide-binding protein
MSTEPLVSRALTTVSLGGENAVERIVAPGGIGTELEAKVIWQLLQVRHLHDTPLLFAGAMWKGLVEWAGATTVLSSARSL